MPDSVPADLLAAVEHATRRRESARAEQLAAIRAAVEAGLPITHVARAAGMSRENIYRLIRK
ncbi:hypothetical protein MUG78_17100 [Gordonia alkaliphila]|uniref:hypothetical protein n=1 Tax=Gordonia alkaliphila TaxID=1053547 RepID=UPI001FF22D30|nr:hypothetical protein [Gordonia alkaliphila]MCK0441119.1 hypothetical protein [Gordonia alkaliphila]